MATIKTTKVFVGNLSFKTTPDELKVAFETVGKVSAANIITRGSRSLGYGFVDFNSEEDANKAVTEMNKRKVDEREINVEIAKPRDESKPSSAPLAPSRGRGGFRGGRGGGGYGRGRYVRGGGGYRRGGGGGFRRRPRAPMRRPPVSTEGRAQSTSTLFVANLPYSLDDAGLAKVFSGLAVKNSHVIRRPNGRSKGFGFVEFETEDDQKKGLNGEKKTVEGRELVIKVALTDDSTKTDGSSSAATTTTTTTSSAPTPSPAPAAASTPVAAKVVLTAPAPAPTSSPAPGSSSPVSAKPVKKT